MQLTIIEATNHGHGGMNWGKFLVARFDQQEWSRKSAIVEDWLRETGSNQDAWMRDVPLLGQIGWAPEHIIVFDLQTCEGAAFRPGGYARADLNKHRVHVCILFETFLAWLYQQDLKDLSALPRSVELECESGIWGYRREGEREPPNHRFRLAAKPGWMAKRRKALKPVMQPAE